MQTQHPRGTAIADSTNLHERADRFSSEVRTVERRLDRLRASVEGFALLLDQKRRVGSKSSAIGESNPSGRST
jgi:hypothetical protein